MSTTAPVAIPLLTIETARALKAEARRRHKLGELNHHVLSDLVGGYFPGYEDNLLVMWQVLNEDNEAIPVPPRVQPRPTDQESGAMTGEALAHWLATLDSQRANEDALADGDIPFTRVADDADIAEEEAEELEEGAAHTAPAIALPLAA